jgi:hypothetical protein
MDIDEGTQELHPDELLAGYVDGSAGPEARREVEAHLAGCERCRSEIELATSARAVLASLPEVEEPGLSRAGLDALRQTPSDAFAASPAPAARTATDRIRSGLSGIHWERVALGAGLAAAAGLFVIFVAVGLTRSTHGSGTTAARGGPAAPGLPRVIDRGAAYSPSTLQALSTQLRAPARTGKVVNQPPAFGAPGQDLTGQSGPVASPTPLPAGQAADAASVLACLRSGTGLFPSAQPIYLEAATYQGTPAYVGGFVLPPVASGSSAHLIVVAVSRNGCQPLFEVRQSL